MNMESEDTRTIHQDALPWNARRFWKLSYAQLHEEMKKHTDFTLREVRAEIIGDEGIDHDLWWRRPWIPLGVIVYLLTRSGYTLGLVCTVAVLSAILGFRSNSWRRRHVVYLISEELRRRRGIEDED